MTLLDLIQPNIALFPEIVLDPKWNSIEVKRIELKSSEVQSGDLFLAIVGSQYDSHADLKLIVNRGPSVMVVQKGSYKGDQFKGYEGIVIEVRSSRRFLAYLAQSFYGHPSRRLFCVGVTGTNGKTSVSCMVEHLLNEMNIPVARIGTLGNTFKDSLQPNLNTTPGPVELAELLRDFELQGARAVVMEVSSHALDQCRTDGVSFNSVIFSNLTHDHLDYHRTMENYFSAKQRLFSDLVYSSGKKPIFASINLDDPWAAKLKINSKASILTFGQVSDADVRFKIQKVDWDGTHFHVSVSDKQIPCFIPLVGEFNVSNFLASYCALSGLGLSLERAISFMQNFRGIPGRIQRVKELKKVVLIDYAHTPDALSKTIKVVRSIRDKQTPKVQSKIWTVFGCGGDRDRSKRPIMGNIAASLSDEVIVTSDNPRTEHPGEIISEVVAGIKNSNKVAYQIEDRARAIQFALTNMAEQDILIVAGKGHEDYQEIDGLKTSFSDYQEILKAGGIL